MHIYIEIYIHAIRGPTQAKKKRKLQDGYKHIINSIILKQIISKRSRSEQGTKNQPVP